MIDYFLDIVLSEMTGEVPIAVSKLCCQRGLWEARAGRELLVPLLTFSRFVCKDEDSE